MPSPEAGDEHLTRDPNDGPALEDDDGAGDPGLQRLQGSFKAQHPGLIGASDEHVEQLPPTLVKSHPIQAQPQREHDNEANTILHAEPTDANDLPSAVFLQRPRSSGEDLGTGFKFGKQQKRQLDMKGRRGPKANIHEPAEPREVPKQGVSDRQDLSSDPQSQQSFHRDSADRAVIESNTSDQQGIGEGQAGQPLEKHSLLQGAQQIRRQSVLFPLHNNSPNALKGAFGIPTVGKSHGKAFTGLAQNQGQKHLPQQYPTFTKSSQYTGAQSSRHKISQAGAAPPLFTGPPLTPSPLAQGSFSKVQGSVHNAPSHDSTSHATSDTQDDAAGRVPTDPESNSTATDQNSACRVDSLSSGHDGESDPTDQTSRLVQPTQAPREQRLQNPLNYQRHLQMSAARSSEPNNPTANHGISSRHGVAKITKPGPSLRNYHDRSKATKRSDMSVAIQQPLGPAQNVHSAQVLGIWQKLVVQEQEELAANEKAKRGKCEQEVMRLQIVEATQKSALDEAKTAKVRATTKLQIYQSANKKLQEDIQKLKQDCEHAKTRSENLETQMQLLEDAKLGTEKKLKALEADKDVQAASAKLALQEAKSDLELVKKELECANEVKMMHERELGQRVGELSESRDKQASLEAQLKGALAKYDNITQVFESRIDSVKNSVDGISKSMDTLGEHQLTKDSIEELLEAMRTATASSSSQANGIENLEAVLEASTTNIQSQLDKAEETRETAQQAVGTLEERLISRLHTLQEKFTSFTSTERKVSEVQQEKAKFEERSTFLEQKVTTLEQQRKEATAGEGNLHALLVEVRNELSDAKATFTSMDSARLRELEASKLAVDQELQKAQTQLRDGEGRFRTLSETERELRREVAESKNQLKEAQASIACLQTEKGTGNGDISKRIESETENARAYFSKQCRELCQQERAKHSNELHQEKEKVRRAERDLKTLSSQVTLLEVQIRQKDAEIHSIKTAQAARVDEQQDLQLQLNLARADQAETQILRDSLTTTNEQLKSAQLKVSDLLKERDSHLLKEQAHAQAKDVQSSLEKSLSQSVEKLKGMAQELATLRGLQQESDLKYQQAQETNRTIQEQLESYKSYQDDLRRQLQEVQGSLVEADFDAEKQRIDADEAFRRLEEQLSADFEDARHQNQQLITQLAETEASNELKCREYEDKLRKYRQPFSSHKSSHRPTIFQQPVAVQEANTPWHDPSRSPSRATPTPAMETPTPAANYGTPRRPRKRLERGTTSEFEVQDITPLDERIFSQKISQSRGALASGSYQWASQNGHPQAQATRHGSTYFPREYDAWAPQELGRHETLTENGVSLRSSTSQAPTEIPETLQDSLSQPILFSNIDREYESLRVCGPSSSSSSLGLEELAGRLPETGTTSQVLGGESSSTHKLTKEFEARETQPSVENPFFQAPRPLSRANMSKRMESASQQRQESHIVELSEDLTLGSSLPRTPHRPPHAVRERGEPQKSSPAFMSQATAKAVYGRRTSHPPRTASSAGSKRGASDSFDQSSTKRVKAVSTEAAASEGPSVRLTRAAVARRRSGSQVSETQNESQYAASDIGRTIEETQSQHTSIKKSESQSQLNTTKESQSQAQYLPNIPAVSRMRSSHGSSSSSSPKVPKGRRKSKIINRFDQELHETKESKTVSRR